jgi:hypothetical protein
VYPLRRAAWDEYVDFLATEGKRTEGPHDLTVSEFLALVELSNQLSNPVSEFGNDVKEFKSGVLLLRYLEGDINFLNTFKDRDFWSKYDWDDLGKVFDSLDSLGKLLFLMPEFDRLMRLHDSYEGVYVDLCAFVGHLIWTEGSREINNMNELANLLSQVDEIDCPNGDPPRMYDLKKVCEIALKRSSIEV